MFFKRAAVYLGAYNTQSACYSRRARTHVDLARDIVEMNPFRPAARDNALCTEHFAETRRVGKRGKKFFQLRLVEFFACFNTPAGKHFVGVMMCVVMPVVMLMSVTTLVFFFVMVSVTALVFFFVVMSVAALVFLFMVVTVATLVFFFMVVTVATLVFFFVVVTVATPVFFF